MTAADKAKLLAEMQRIVDRHAAGEYVHPCTLGMALGALGLTRQAVAT